MIAFDSNILVYAIGRGEDPRHEAASDLIYAATLPGAVIPLQVIAEFLNVCRRKLKLEPQRALDQVADYYRFFECPETIANDLIDAADLAHGHSLQFFDALIVVVAARTGATVLLSEDMQDQQQFGALRILNPFKPANAGLIADLLG